MEQVAASKRNFLFLSGILILLGLYLTSLYNYLLFHSLAEIFSIAVACGIFMITWNSRRFLDNNYLLFIGIVFLFVGGLDLIHTLAYKGMGVFQGYETNLPTQLWIASRYVEAISLFVAPLFLSRKLKPNFVFLGYAIAISILLLSIFYFDIFPVCFIEGVGLTAFKKISEYIISMILLGSIALLLRNRKEFDWNVLQWLIWSIILSVVSELAFTFYMDPYGLSNLIGHFLKIASFYLIYKAIIETGLTKPYALLFRNLRQSEERFRHIFEKSPMAIELYDSDGQLVDANKACLEIFGGSDVEEVKGFKLFEDPNLSEEVKENLKLGKVLRYEAPFDFQKVKEHKLYETTKSGISYLDVLITPLGAWQKGSQSGYLVQVQDITERKRAEGALRESEQRFRQANELLEAVTKGTNVIIAAQDTDLRYTFFNTAYAAEIKRLTGKDIRVGCSMAELFANQPDQLAVAEREWREVLAGNTTNKRVEFGEPDLHRRVYSILHTPIPDTNGRVVGAGEVAYDITEQVRAEEALRKNKARFEILSETASKLLGTDKPQEVVNDLCQKLMTYLDCQVFFNYLVDEEKGRLHLNAYAGIPEKTGKEVEWLDYGAAVCGCAARDACRIVAEDIPNTPDPRTELVKSFGIKAYACHPLFSTGRVIGTLSFGTRFKTTFTEEELSLMKIVADQVAVAMERIRLIEALRKSRDELEIRVQERTMEVREQSRILDSFFKFSITPFVILDKDFNFVRVNEAYAKACHREVAEFPGHNHFEFYPSDAKAKFEQVVQTKKPYVAIARPFSFPDHPEWGVTYWDWILTPILDDAGEVGSLVFSLEDVTPRRRAEEAIKAERQRSNDVLEMLPAYLVLLSPDYHVHFANRFFRERFGESHGRRCFEYLFGRSEPCEICETYTVLKTMAPHKWEWTGPDARNYDVFDFPFTDTDGSLLILEMGIDITQRKKAEEAVRAASLYTRSLIEASLDSLATISADGKIMDVNSATELTTGVPRHEIIGTDFSDYFTESDKAREGYQRVFREGFVRDYPLAIRHASGKVTDVLYHATVFRDEAGVIQGVFAAARDITARKRGEAALRESENRLRLLSSQLINVQEAERKRIAREIHDSIGQTLAAIKFALESKLSQMSGGSAPPGVSIEDIISLTQSGIEESRRIQMDLRPSILDDLGILATIGWFTREFQKVYAHISVEKHISVEEREIPDSLRTVLFRVMQEAMNNVSKHSKADLIRLSLRKIEDRAELSIEDNGGGFDPEKIKRGLGLTSMRERTELSGGSFEIESILGKGTRIRASWHI